MMVDIFSSFDDHNSTLFSAHFMTWSLSLWSLFFINSSYWVNPSNLTNMMNMPKQAINIQVTRSFSMNLGGFSLLISSLFITIINFNMLGLMPYVFSTTSHLAMTFTLALPLWLSLIMSSYANNPYSSLAFMLPLGTPSFLMPFLPIIETLSIMVRPITLSIRLAANISAGHIILTLIGDYLTISMLSNNYFVSSMVMLIQIGYFIFEIGIGIIQGYIFSLLITLYTDDHQ
uniref:ATP synthase F0 subunit 6 n=1 Tax=Mastigoteuthis agassizii TaxID=1346166 RepID=UPI00286A13AC|nr:ATP synthase F0 subunit 6 [Mastigoteuthis agassizii]YP_010944777.1 ATP synthase F0 subunit 6 [Mastigoteuthis agassizii]WMC20869.1 ATP synthase F0 subunit 6 [Mastigoteuthis agassizii]WMC20875.1 ATP synthase F0 subunit 6 [Mastigoteuthis agassizii]WMC20959.1 ATP synthase F0 subunit 6 [Mastigoteuthis agassizii]WMC20965.1 ATP synthase F0 subunit 6 [Mastigoteuthis agassizii]